MNITENKVKCLKAMDKSADLDLSRKERKAEVVALRNQLLDEVKKSVEYDEKADVVRMKRKDYDILIGD